MLKRGFISRSASVATLVGALALLSSISGVTAGTIDDSVGDAQLSPSSLVFSSTSADGFSYSRWLENQGTVPASADSASTDESQADQGQAPITYGSFVLTETPLERIYGNVKDSWTQTFSNIITRAGDTSMLRGWAMDYVTGQEVDMQANIDSWWDQRQADTTGIFVGMADVLTDNIFQAGEDQAGGLSFIRSLDWDYQTELGGRPWQLGVNAIGSLREADDDVMLWQLRGFTAKDSKGGANAGLIYRWAQEDTAMFGVNTFLDFEAHDRGDFLRWSVGGEVRTEWVDLYGNRYLAITDPRLQDDGNYAYTKDGLDIEAAFHVPNMRWVSGYIKYYLFESKGTDPETGDNNPDEKGFVYGVKVSPPMAENLRLELELDDQDGGDLDVGGRISYRHEFGGVPAGTRTAGASSFDPRDYFFDAVRREYAQRIGIYGAGGDDVTAYRGVRFVLSNSSEVVTVVSGESVKFSRSEPITVGLELTVAAADVPEQLIEFVNSDTSFNSSTYIGVLSGSRASYDMAMRYDTTLSFQGNGNTVALENGRVYLETKGDPGEVHFGDIKIASVPGFTQFDVGYDYSSTRSDYVEVWGGTVVVAYDGSPTLSVTFVREGQLQDGASTYHACNDAIAFTSAVNVNAIYYGVTTVADCSLEVGTEDIPDSGFIYVPVEQDADENLVIYKVSKGGVGNYTFELTSNPKGYFYVSSDDPNTFNIGVVQSVSIDEDGERYTLRWSLDDEHSETPAVTGFIVVEFTQRPNAENAVRYVVEGQLYNDSVSVVVAGGVPSTVVGAGYTFELVGDPTGYDLESPTGSTIVLIAENVNVPATGQAVTVSIQDSQDPPQSGTFVLEVRRVSVLTFAEVSATAIEGIEEVIDLTPYAMGGNVGNADAKSELSFRVDPPETGFNVGNDNKLTVSTAVVADVYDVPIVVAETNPAHQGTGAIIISVAGALAAEYLSDVIVPVGLVTQIDQIKASGGIGAYTFDLMSDSSGYISINSSLGLVSVNNAPESEDGKSYFFVWTLNDGDDRSPEVTGTVSVQFTKAPSAENELRYVVVDAPYSENIAITVVGGVPDASAGYTFALVGSPSGYALAANNGGTITLEANAATYTAAGVNYVTVSIYDGQTPPQSGTFVLEVRAVPVLTFSDAALTIFQTESASLLSFVGGGNTDYPDDNTRTFGVISDSEGFTAGNDGVLAVGGAAELLGLNTVTVQVMDTTPSQSATAALVISVEYKATPVAFDSDNINLPSSVDPDVDVPLSITLKATGGAEAPSYTFSITEGDQTWLTIVSPNILVVGDGAPGSGTATFKVEVVDGNSTTDNTAELEISFTFMRPQAKAEVKGGKVVVSGAPEAGVNGEYGDGDTIPDFDPRPSTGEVIFLDVSGADDDLDTNVVVNLQNGDIQLTASYTPSTDLFSSGSGEWFFASASVIAQKAQDGGLSATFNGRPLQFSNAQDITDALNSPVMVAISAPGNSAVGKINSSVPFLYCAKTEAFGANAYDCQIIAPDPSAASTTYNRSVSSVDSETVIPSSVRLPAGLQSRESSPVGPWLGGVSGSLQDPVAVRGGGDRVLLPAVATPEANCEVTPSDCRYKTAVIVGNNFAVSLPEYVLLDDLANNGVGNLYAFFPYGGRFLFRDASNAIAQTFEAGFTLEYQDNCMVTLGSDGPADCGSSSSFAFASN